MTQAIASIEVAAITYNTGSPKARHHVLIGLTNGSYITVPYGDDPHALFSSPAGLVDKIRDEGAAP